MHSSSTRALCVAFAPYVRYKHDLNVAIRYQIKCVNLQRFTSSIVLKTVLNAPVRREMSWTTVSTVR